MASLARPRRDRDVEDAAAVLSALGAGIDRELIEREVRQLATEIPDHDVAGRWRAVGAAVMRR